ncbi:hypothetical protein HDU84_007114 [Entophlyctis sp. JEL0112]|nr:hypothetical protein HDU84_007114 [Entophlyctis sp. JEL0112]
MGHLEYPDVSKSYGELPHIYVSLADDNRCDRRPANFQPFIHKPCELFPDNSESASPRSSSLIYAEGRQENMKNIIPGSPRLGTKRVMADGGAPRKSNTKTVEMRSPVEIRSTDEAVFQRGRFTVRVL